MLWYGVYAMKIPTKL